MRDFVKRYDAGEEPQEKDFKYAFEEYIRGGKRNLSQIKRTRKKKNQGVIIETTLDDSEQIYDKYKQLLMEYEKEIVDLSSKKQEVDRMERDNKSSTQFFLNHEYRDLIEGDKEEFETENVLIRKKIRKDDDEEGGSMLWNLNKRVEEKLEIDNWLETANNAFGGGD